MNKQTTWLSFYSTSFLAHVLCALSTVGTIRKRLHIDQQGHWLTVSAGRGETEAARLGSSPHQRNTLVLVKRSKVIQLPSSNRGRSSRPPAAFTLCSMSFKRKQTTRTSRHKPAEQRIPQQDVTNSFIRRDYWLVEYSSTRETNSVMLITSVFGDGGYRGRRQTRQDVIPRHHKLDTAPHSLAAHSDREGRC